MKLKSRQFVVASLLAVACSMAVTGADAAAVIENAAGTLRLGVNDLGNLNFRDPAKLTENGGEVVPGDPTTAGTTGLAKLMGPLLNSSGDIVRPRGWYDATSPGCLCEGWGVSVNNTTSGYANVAGGTAGLSSTSFASTPSTATSVVGLAALSGISVTHSFASSSAAPGALFEVKVKIENTTGADVNNVKYVRVMDWDVPFTEFSEFVTIGGTATTSYLERSHDNGFNTSDPLGGDSALDATTEDTDFVDKGASDHGAYFRFNFGTIKSGDSFEFSIFYGATDNEAGAFAAMTSAGIELYSLGQSNGGEATGEPATFIFGFKGVGGVVVGVPAPGSLALVGLGLLGAGMVRRRRA